MTKEKLKELISQGDTAKVDFKREWYKKEDLKGEFVKDMLALTNGDVNSIDKEAHLIIGITDNRNFYDFDSSFIRSPDKLKQQLLNILNSYTQPEFTALEVEWVEFSDEQDVVVVSVPPRAKLLSLSKDLQLKKGTDKKGIVYYRIGEDIKVASVDVVLDFEKAFNESSSESGVTININGDVNGIGTVTGGTVTQTLTFNK